MDSHILAIDQGTTNTKAILVNAAGAIVARGAVATPVYYPKPGWVEQDPREIWDCVRLAMAQCLASYAPTAPRIAAVAVSNQRETALLWDRDTGEPVGPAVVWQCRRSAVICESLREAGHAELVQRRTGLQIDPMFSAGKLRWLLEHSSDALERARRGELCAGNVDAWLLWNLTGGSGSTAPVHATDATNASRTQLMDLRNLAWDPEIAALFGIPLQILPEIHLTAQRHGETAPIAWGGSQVLPGGIPIASLVGDSHGSLFGLGGYRAGSLKATYGTGTSLMTPAAELTRSSHGLSSTVAWALGDMPSRPVRRTSADSHRSSGSLSSGSATYALEGNIYTTGGAVQYIGDLLGLSDSALEIEALAKTVETAGSVLFVPALVGLGAPHWQDSAQGTISGLTLGTGRAHLARAALEAIAFQVRDVFDVMQAEAGTPLRTLLADGGASRNDTLMQFQADILGCPVERSQSSEVSALGAAYLAGLAVGMWHSRDEITAILPACDRFEPQMGAHERATVYARWQRAVRNVLLDARSTS